MNSDFLYLFIVYLFRGSRNIVDVTLTRERVGAYRTTHLISLGMAQAPGLGHAGRRRIEGQAVCRPRGVEHLQDVPRVLMHSNLGAKTSRGLCLYFANSKFSRRRLCIRATASTPQFRQITYFSRLPKNPFRRRVTMASFCCQPIPRSYDPHQAQWLTGICGCFVSLLFIKSPTSPAEPDWPISCSYQMRGCRYPA